MSELEPVVQGHHLGDDDFRLFGLPRRFVLERSALDERWREMQALAHPDRFVSEGAGAQRAAMQWAIRINEAYSRLKQPLARAAYLCELMGEPVQAQNNAAMPAGFLNQQMTWREAVQDADSAASLRQLDAQVASEEKTLFDHLAELLDRRGDAAAAVELVRALMFTARLRADIDRRLDAIEA